MELESFYCVLQFASPGGGLHNLGVLLYDSGQRSLLTLFRRDYEFASAEDQEVLFQLHDDLVAKAAAARDPIDIIAQLEDVLSNSLRITDRSAIQIEGNPDEVLTALYRRLCSGEPDRKFEL